MYVYTHVQIHIYMCKKQILYKYIHIYIHIYICIHTYIDMHSYTRLRVGVLITVCQLSSPPCGRVTRCCERSGASWPWKAGKPPSSAFSLGLALLLKHRLRDVGPYEGYIVLVILVYRYILPRVTALGIRPGTLWRTAGLRLDVFGHCLASFSGPGRNFWPSLRPFWYRHSYIVGPKN